VSVSGGLNGGWGDSGTASRRSAVLVRVWGVIWPLPAWVVGVLVRVLLCLVWVGALLRGPVSGSGGLSGRVLTLVLGLPLLGRSCRCGTLPGGVLRGAAGSW